MFKSLSRAENQWLFIKLIASAYSFWINYCFTSKYTSSSNISCIQLYLNEYVISTIIKFSPLRAGKCFVLLNSFSVYSGLRLVCFLYAAMLCSAYFLFSFVTMTEIAVYCEFYFCDSSDADWAVPSRLAF